MKDNLMRCLDGWQHLCMRLIEIYAVIWHYLLFVENCLLFDMSKGCVL